MELDYDNPYTEEVETAGDTITPGSPDIIMPEATITPDAPSYPEVDEFVQPLVEGLGEPPADNPWEQPIPESDPAMWQ